MTDSEIFEAGALCEALLSSFQFKAVVAQYEQSIASDFLATKPDDKTKREELYASLWGARGLLAYMQLNVDAAASIKAKADHPVQNTGYEVLTYDDEGFEID